MRELVGPFLFSLAAFSSLFIGSDLLQLAKLTLENGIGAPVLLTLLCLRLPQIMVWIFPMAMLMATLLTLSRLSASSEIVAMRAGGYSTGRIIAVVLLVGLAVSCLGFWVEEFVTPLANARYARMLQEEIQKEPVSTKRSNMVLREFAGGELTRLVFAREYDGASRTMHGVTIQEFRGGRLARTLLVERVAWEGQAWYYTSGEAYDYLPDGRVLRTRFRAVKQQLPLPQQPQDLARAAKRPEEMSWRELGEYLRLLAREGQTSGPEVWQARVQWHQKLAIPLASLLFAFVGAPLGIQSHRHATSRGFGLSIAIIFIYYVLMTLGASLGEGGAIPAGLGGWLQNLVLGGAGLYLARKAV